MTQQQAGSKAWIREEVTRVKGIYYPIRAGRIRRFLIRKLAPELLHPNPGDEFCDPEIGPNREIIAGYERAYRESRGDYGSIAFLQSAASEPIIVQRTAPDGYMILNGHHRWVAALRAGMKKVPVEIVDLTQEKDVLRMLRRAGSGKRAVMDLDEVVFDARADAEAGKAKRAAALRVFGMPIRAGVPALCHELNSHGYDLWVFTSGYYSEADIRDLFRRHQMPVTGIVTGTGRKHPASAETVRKLRELMDEKYGSSTTIDLNMVIRTTAGEKGAVTRELKETGPAWEAEVMRVIGELDRNE